MFAMTLRNVEQATGGKIVRGDPDVELTGVATDSRAVRPGDVFFALEGARFDGHSFLAQVASRRGSAAVVRRKDAASPAPALPVIVVKDVGAALAALAHWHRKRCPATVIGITGSNGKTTTKDMLYEILSGVVSCIRTEGNQNNQLGVPLTLFRLRPEHAYAVVEMGTNSPGEIATLCEIARPDMGLITNITATHLEGLGSIDGVAREKGVLLRQTSRRGGAFYNADDFMSRQVVKSLKGAVHSFGFENESGLRGFHLRSRASDMQFKVVGGPRIRMGVPGAHNASNALGAIAVARKVGIDWSTIGARLAGFSLPPQRMQVVRAGDVTLINDAYNANPVSTEAAAATLARMECSGRKVLVLGDMLELGEMGSELHRRLGRTIAGMRFDHVFGIGPLAAEALASAQRQGMNASCVHRVDDGPRLADELLRLLRAGDIALFKGSRGVHLESVIEQVEAGLRGPKAENVPRPVSDAAVILGRPESGRGAVSPREAEAARHLVG